MLEELEAEAQLPAGTICEAAVDMALYDSQSCQGRPLAELQRRARRLRIPLHEHEWAISAILEAQLPEGLSAARQQAARTPARPGSGDGNGGVMQPQVGVAQLRRPGAAAAAAAMQVLAEATPARHGSGASGSGLLAEAGRGDVCEGSGRRRGSRSSRQLSPQSGSSPAQRQAAARVGQAGEPPSPEFRR